MCLPRESALPDDGATTTAAPQRFAVLGVKVSALDPRAAVSAVDRFIRHGQKTYVCVSGVHGVVESLFDEELRAIHNRAGLVTPDGMPLVWMGRLLRVPLVARVYGPDLMLQVCEHGLTKGYRHFFYGGGRGIAEQLARRLQERFAGLQIAGVYSPPFGPVSEELDAQIQSVINDANADIVWVGLSTPAQERWMAAHRSRLSAPVLIGVGAAFDFNAGSKAQAPAWMRRNGLEWLFRLSKEPRRLWRRYLRANPVFVYHAALQLTGLRRYQ